MPTSTVLAGELVAELQNSQRQIEQIFSQYQQADWGDAWEGKAGENAKKEYRQHYLQLQLLQQELRQISQTFHSLPVQTTLAEQKKATAQALGLSH